MTTPMPELPIVAYGRTINASGDEPLCKLSDALAAIEAATEEGKPQPLTDEQVQKILFQVQINWAKSPPTHEFAPAFARAIEAAHGITATPQGKI